MFIPVTPLTSLMALLNCTFICVSAFGICCTARPASLTTRSGFVAKTRECAIAGPSDEIAASDGQPKQLFDKPQLREWVTFAHPFGSPLPDHVDRLDPL